MIGYNAPKGPCPLRTSRSMSKPPAVAISGREAMIPPSPFECWSQRVHPQGKRRLIRRRVCAEFVGRTQSQPALELRIASGPALQQHAIERAFQTTLGTAVVGAPVAEPDRPRIGRVDGANDQIDTILRVVVASHRACEQLLRCWVAHVVPDEIGVALSVRGHECADNAQAVPYWVKILTVACDRPVGDESFEIEFVCVYQQSYERLFVIRVATGVRLNDDAQTLIRRRADGNQERNQPDANHAGTQETRLGMERVSWLSFRLLATDCRVHLLAPRAHALPRCLVSRRRVVV